MCFDATHHIWQSFLNLLFPIRCAGCKSEGEIMCGTCTNQIERPFNEVPGVQALWSYQDKHVARAIWKLKYGGQSSSAECLGKYLGEFVLSDLADEMILDTQGALIIPAPLSPERLRERGYNQAELLAKGMAKVTNITLATNVVEKVIHTRTQVSLKNRAQRLDNLHGAFAVSHPELVIGKLVIIIDDVHTTGTTIREITRVLEESGAREVLGYTLAH